MKKGINLWIMIGRGKNNKRIGLNWLVNFFFSEKTFLTDRMDDDVYNGDDDDDDAYDDDDYYE